MRRFAMEQNGHAWTSGQEHAQRKPGRAVVADIRRVTPRAPRVVMPAVMRALVVGNLMLGGLRSSFANQMCRQAG